MKVKKKSYAYLIFRLQSQTEGNMKTIIPYVNYAMKICNILKIPIKVCKIDILKVKLDIRACHSNHSLNLSHILR